MRRFFSFLLILVLLAVPVHSAQPAKYIALTFDDGPSGRFTEALLAGLQERNVDATFFLCGYRLETWPELARTLRAQGHEIGLHGYSHSLMTRMTPAQITDELARTRDLLPAGCPVSLMRTPGGAISDSVRQAAKEQGLSIIHWSADPEDWDTGSAQLVVRRVLEQVEDGAVILLHDMSDSSVEAALELVDRLKADGYRFLTVSQLAMLRLCQLRPGRQYRGFQP